MEQLEYQKLENILGNIENLENLKKDSLLISGIKSKSDKWEKKIQDIIKIYFEFNLKTTIIEEEFKDIKELQSHNYILVDKLRKNIERLNQNIFSSFTHISKDTITETILKSFISDFDKTKNNAEKYQLIFQSKSIELENINKEKEQINYTLLDLSDYNNNEITIIKEKKINDQRIIKQCELPDFAYYINGLPFIAIEVKTPETGTKAALKDYQNKISYQNFLSVIGTDGNRAFIGTNPKNEDIYYWSNYGNNVSFGGFKDISNELLFNLYNILFYFQFGILSVNGNDGLYLKNARVQQYYVLKKYHAQFKSIVSVRNNNELIQEINTLKQEIINNPEQLDFINYTQRKIKEKKSLLKNSKSELELITFKNYFKHHTRTGKSFTFKLILNLLTQKFSQLFKKIYIFTHDLTVKESLDKEFGIYQFKNLYGTIKKIENKIEYKDSIIDNNRGVYLLNIQKTELPQQEQINYNNIQIKTKNKAISNQYLNDDILFIIDEIHTHQNTNDGYAFARQENFPNASYITATATPAIIEKNGVLINITKEYFGEEIDNFSPSDAIRLEIVVPLTYQKYLWELEGSNHEIIELKSKLELIEDRLQETSFFKIKGGKITLTNKDNDKNKATIEYEGILDKIINELAHTYEIQSLFEKGTNIEEAIQSILNHEACIRNDSYETKIVEQVENKFNSILTQKITEVYKKQKEEVLYTLSRNLIPQKLNIISKDVKFLKSQTKFKPKFFWIVEDIKTGLSIITYIKKLNQNKHGHNIFNDLRFGLDVSSIVLDSIDSDDKLYLENNSIKIDDINGEYVAKSPNRKNRSDAIYDFESDKDNSIDVLIIVGKYLMGYDLDKLLKVYLDTKIKDIKKIIQVATRASTKKQDKDKSFILDLTLDDETKSVYERALAIYDDESDIDSFFIDQNVIDTELKNLEGSLEDVSIFMNSRYEILEGKKDQIISKEGLVTKWYECVDTLISETTIDKKLNQEFGNNSYWLLIKNINKVLKKLIAPKYYINSEKTDFSKFIDAIMKINTIFFAKMLYKESNETIILSNSEIKEIIKDTFKLLSIDFGEQLENISDLIKFKDTIDSNILEINSRKKIEIKSSLYSLSTKLQSPPLPAGIANELKKLIEEIENNSDIMENWNKIQNITDIEFKKIVETIQNEYEDNLIYFIISYNLLEYHKELINKNKDWINITKKIAKLYAKKISDLISYQNYSQLRSYSEDILITILKDLKLSDINTHSKILDKTEISILAGSGYKKDYIDSLDINNNKNIDVIFYNILEEIFNKENIYEYYYKLSN